MTKEADNFWHELDAKLDEEEQALEEFRDYLNHLTIEEAEAAVHGLHEYLKEVSHPPVEDLVQGWEQQLIDKEDKPFRWDVI